MGRYLGSWKLEDVVAVHVQTSSVTTGAATDGDSVPTWRMYEDATATPVTTGSFTTLNAQTGFYVAQITLASAIGYEKGKSYGLRVACTVGAVIGADVHSLQIEAEVDVNSASTTINAHVASMTAGAITANVISAGALTLAKFAADAVAGLTTVGATAASAIATATQALPMTLGATAVAAVSAAVTANSIGPVTVSSTSRATLVDEIWDEPKVGHTTADTYGEYLDATVSGVSGGAGDTTVSATAAAAIAAAVWDEPKASHTTADTFGEFLDATVSGIAAGDTTVSATAAAAIADAVWDEAGAGHVGAGSFGARLNVTINSMTAGAIGPVTVNAASQTALVNAITAGSIGAVTVGATAASAIATATQALAMTLGSTAVAAVQSGLATQVSVDAIDDLLDTEVGAIKAKTDQLTFTVANQIDANVRYVNGVSVTGNGQSGTEWGPGT